MNLYEQIHPRLAKEYAHIVDRYDSNGTIIYVLALNVVIFLVWQVAHIGATSQRALPALRNLLPFMKRHFLMDPQVALKPSRWHTCLTSMFSHQHAWHIVANSMVLVSFGGIVHQAVGRELWLLIYIGGGVFGCLAQILAKTKFPVHGASAGVLAILAANVLFSPYDQKMGLMFTPRSWYLPKPDALALLIAVDLVGLARGWKFFAHAAHLGGTAFGLASLWLLGQTVGSTEHGECLYKSCPYEGPLRMFYPTGRGLIHEEDGDYRTRIETNGKRRSMFISKISHPKQENVNGTSQL